MKSAITLPVIGGMMEMNRECYGKAEGHLTQLGHEDGGKRC